MCDKWSQATFANFDALWLNFKAAINLPVQIVITLNEISFSYEILVGVACMHQRRNWPNIMT